MAQVTHKQAVQYIRQSLELDQEGFLTHPSLWTRETARILAEMDGIGTLGPEHWAVIYYLRDHYESYQSIPPMAQVCRSQQLERHAVRRLFGGCREAWRIAGLPDPGEEARAYM
jgi:TusE/DsrC/DsvC family sulfur relay protein